MRRRMQEYRTIMENVEEGVWRGPRSSVESTGVSLTAPNHPLMSDDAAKLPA